MALKDAFEGQQSDPFSKLNRQNTAGLVAATPRAGGSKASGLAGSVSRGLAQGQASAAQAQANARQDMVMKLKLKELQDQRDAAEVAGGLVRNSLMNEQLQGIARAGLGPFGALLMPPDHDRNRALAKSMQDAVANEAAWKKSPEAVIGEIQRLQTLQADELKNRLALEEHSLKREKLEMEKQKQQFELGQDSLMADVMQAATQGQVDQAEAMQARLQRAEDIAKAEKMIDEERAYQDSIESESGMRSRLGATGKLGAKAWQNAMRENSRLFNQMVGRGKEARQRLVDLSVNLPDDSAVAFLNGGIEEGLSFLGPKVQGFAHSNPGSEAAVNDAIRKLAPVARAITEKGNLVQIGDAKIQVTSGFDLPEQYKDVELTAGFIRYLRSAAPEFAKLASGIQIEMPSFLAQVAPDLEQGGKRDRSIDIAEELFQKDDEIKLKVNGKSMTLEQFISKRRDLPTGVYAKTPTRTINLPNNAWSKLSEQERLSWAEKFSVMMRKHDGVLGTGHAVMKDMAKQAKMDPETWQGLQVSVIPGLHEEYAALRKENPGMRMEELTATWLEHVKGRVEQDSVYRDFQKKQSLDQEKKGMTGAEQALVDDKAKHRKIQEQEDEMSVPDFENVEQILPPAQAAKRAVQQDLESGIPEDQLLDYLKSHIPGLTRTRRKDGGFDWYRLNLKKKRQSNQPNIFKK